MPYRQKSLQQDSLSSYFKEVKSPNGSTFLCFYPPGCNVAGHNFRGIYRKNPNRKISESDVCELNDFLQVLRNNIFEGNRGGHLDYRPLNEEEINYCIDTLKREHGVDKIPGFNLNIYGKTVDFQTTGRNGQPVYKAHAFLIFSKNSTALRDSLFFDNNGDNSHTVKCADCNRLNAINTINIQGQFNSCSYWTICAANEVLMSAKNRTFERDLSNGTLHRNILKRFQYIQHCAENKYLLVNLQKI